MAHLQKIHQPGGIVKSIDNHDNQFILLKSLFLVPELITQSKELFASKIRPQLAALAELIPSNQYYRFNAMFCFPMQRFCYAAALTKYLETEKLILRDELAQDYLGVKVDPKEGFHLDLEDYLGGLILTSNELVGLYFLAIPCMSLLISYLILGKIFGEQRHSWRLLSPSSHFCFSQRSFERLPPPQPEERQSQKEV